MNSASSSNSTPVITPGRVLARRHICRHASSSSHTYTTRGRKKIRPLHAVAAIAYTAAHAGTVKTLGPIHIQAGKPRPLSCPCTPHQMQAEELRGADAEPLPGSASPRQDVRQPAEAVADDSPPKADEDLWEAAGRLLVDPSHILRCMRVWFAQGRVESRAHDDDDPGGTRTAAEDLPNDALSVEEACCTLWDLTANEECAAFMVGAALRFTCCT